MSRTISFAVTIALLSFVSSTLPAADFPVYPLPHEIGMTGDKLDLEGVEIISSGPTDHISAGLARYLSLEMADRYGISLIQRQAETLEQGPPAIVIGLATDPLVKKGLEQLGVKQSDKWSAAEGYQLAVSSKLAVVAGGDPAGLFYGLQSLIQLVESPAYGRGHLKGALINDRPFKPIRGVHVYLPARNDIPFFKNFIRLMAHFKINTLIIEVGGGMQLDRHPEINIGWEHFCKAFYDMGDPFVRYGEQVPLGPEGRFQASVHTELAGGRWLTKAEVRDIVEFARRHHMNVVPEIQSLTHSYYLVIPHREIAEIKDADWPDSYDATNPKSYEILFDVIDEYLEVMEPEWVHIGHDEWRAGISGDTGKTFGEDVLKIYGYLNSKGVKTMMWADHFVHGHNAEAGSSAKTPGGVWYVHPSTESSAGIVSKEAEDILMLNWSWGFVPGSDAELEGYGWKQIFGNFSGARRYDRWPERLAQESVLGVEMSTWCLADELSFGQNGSILNMLLSGNLLWSSQTPPLEEILAYLSGIMPGVREILSGRRLPSMEVGRGRPGYGFQPIDLSDKVSSAGKTAKGIDPERYKAGRIEHRGMPFLVGADKGKYLTVTGPGESIRDIPVNSHAAGLLFLHVTIGEGKRGATYNSNYPEDTAEPVGFYRIKYSDGLQENIAIRSARNISHHQADYSDQRYFAHTVKLGSDGQGKPILAFACEWTNPRPNRKIESVDLVGLQVKSKVLPVLLGVTMVKQPFTE